MSAQEDLAEVAAEVAECTKCVLHHSRKQAVPGEGPAQVEIMFIGEGPGFHENEQGRPFVGAAGQFLDQLLAQAKLKRADVWITNIVKCRPPGNRDPLPEEVKTCNQYLERQIKILNPKIIITLGRHSMSSYMPGAKISLVHGQMRKIGDRYVIAMYHPAAALHQASIKPAILADFAKLPALLTKVSNETNQTDDARPIQPGKTPKTQKPREDPKQLNLF